MSEPTLLSYSPKPPADVLSRHVLQADVRATLSSWLTLPEVPQTGVTCSSA